MNQRGFGFGSDLDQYWFEGGVEDYHQIGDLLVRGLRYEDQVEDDHHIGVVTEMW